MVGTWTRVLNYWIHRITTKSKKLFTFFIFWHYLTHYLKSVAHKLELFGEVISRNVAVEEILFLTQLESGIKTYDLWLHSDCQY